VRRIGASLDAVHHHQPLDWLHFLDHRPEPAAGVRAIMLKGATLQNLQYDTIALLALMLVAMTIAVTRFRRTLD
jgi:hypothetical protein